MIKKNQRIINLLNAASDAFLVFAAYYIALYVRLELLHGWSELGLFSPKYAAVIAAYSLLVVFIYLALRMYGSYRFKEPGSEIMTILLVNGVSVLGFMAFLYVTRVMEFPRLAVFLFWTISSLLVIGKRLIGRSVLRHYRKLGYNQKHMLLVGSGPLARQYLKDVAANPQMGVTVDGYLQAEQPPRVCAAADAETELQTNSLEETDQRHSANHDTDTCESFPKEYACPCLGIYGNLEQVLQQQDFDEVIVALESDEMAQVRSVLAAVEKEGVRVSLIPIYSEYIPSQPVINAVGRSKLIDLRATPLDNIGWAMFKRAMDIIGSLVLIVLTSPIMLATAIGVKLSSPGPVLFKQERIGKDRKPFQMLKFRSMRVTDTEQTGWTTDTDPRKTRFGSFIRKWSIDELVQLWNTLTGSMSLVGPRPEVPYHVRHFKEEIPRYLIRQQVRPGITGWAQVHGLR
ncbi:MAG: sugar transferase, partial [Muribaculaceae bacterium]|nr:sugar transferase [Muribaculaceae bacterium]